MPEHVATAINLRKELESQFNRLGLMRSFQRTCYDPGHQLKIIGMGIVPANEGKITVTVKDFVGGGFAGQVYKVQLTDSEGAIEGLEVGKHYAIKILKPPSGLACAFRNFLYFLAYQSHFGPEANPDAVRVGVLWQKLIRRAAAVRFQDPGAVCDTFATFYDADNKSFGEINEWIDGRIWKFEVDDRLFQRWRFQGAVPEDHNCPEYVSKKKFMDDLVKLLHEMGAGELARQYEWWTMKSQPNALKRTATDSTPHSGVTAIDFRAGLTLLPFLPMSPADFILILKGLIHGRWVQFDRSDPKKFRQFVQEHANDFQGLEPAIDELKIRESAYRRSMPDVTGHHVRLVTDSSLRRSIQAGTITNWKYLDRIDAGYAAKLEKRKGLFFLLFLVSLFPFLGKRILKLWGNARAREHIVRCCSSGSYLLRAMEGSRIETLVQWQRDGRMRDDRILNLVHRPVRYWLQRIVFGWMPPRLHRFLAEPSFAWQKIRETVSFMVRLLRVPAFREEYLLGQVKAGREEGMLTESEADRIKREVKDPYIQKYLRCWAVHVCTVPVTQVVMVVAGAAVAIYCFVYQQMSWDKCMGLGTVTAAAIQLSPVSPGSIARGLFVIFMMIKDRDWKNYWIAAPVSFIHVVGYLAFPLQMATHNPALARFLAGKWTKDIVHIVPVFGERGGLLEHGVFDFFFNLPLTVRRGFRTNPISWTLGSLITAGAVAGLLFLGFGWIWEIFQPKDQIRQEQVISITSFNHRAGDLLWPDRGTAVRFEGNEVPIEYPAGCWDDSIQVGDVADAVIRKNFFGAGYEGYAILSTGDARNKTAMDGRSPP
ncbi:MAG: hypothetical protein JW829_13480 [Pirellulales bacterium]|nr:hypothetical protein [Pirellulales bacterium]